MYALGNLEKFLRDNAGRLGRLADGIIERARAVSHKGVLSGGSVEEIMRDDVLAREFHETAMGDPEYVAIGLEAIRAAM